MPRGVYERKNIEKKSKRKAPKKKAAKQAKVIEVVETDWSALKAMILDYAYALTENARLQTTDPVEAPVALAYMEWSWAKLECHLLKMERELE